MVYENDEQIEFRPQHMPMPTLTAEQLQYKREMQVLMQRRVQMQEWKQQQAIQAQLAQQLGAQVPVTLRSTPIPSAPEPTQNRKRTARQMTKQTTPQMVPQISEMAKQMLMPLPLPTVPVCGPPDYGLQHTTL